MMRDQRGPGAVLLQSSSQCYSCPHHLKTPIVETRPISVPVKMSVGAMRPVRIAFGIRGYRGETRCGGEGSRLNVALGGGDNGSGTGSLERAYRVPAIVRWPGHIKPGSVSNEIFSGHDWFATLLAAAGDPGVKERLLTGWQIGDRTYKVHLDGYNQLAYLTGQQEHSDRKGFIYVNDDGQLVAIRFGNWKLVFMEQKTPGTLDIWGEPFTARSLPLFFNLRMDPFERAQTTSNSYFAWTLHKGYMMMRNV
jgi:arylsulfatase A-like enzyme